MISKHFRTRYSTALLTSPLPAGEREKAGIEAVSCVR